MAVDSIGSQYQNYSPTQLKGQQLDQKDFLRLMTAQLSSQDPFNPVDNQQMVAQMAQFSSLAGVSETITTLKARPCTAAATRGGGNTSGSRPYSPRSVVPKRPGSSVATASPT